MKGKSRGAKAASKIRNTAKNPRSSTAQLRSAVAKTGKGSKRQPVGRNPNTPMNTNIGGVGDIVGC